MKFRLSLILAIFFLVVTPIVLTGLVTVETAEKALENQAAQNGFLFQGENTEIHRLQENIIYMFIIGTVVSLAGAGIFTSDLAGSVNGIKKGLDELSRDVNMIMRPQRGVLGEIVTSINQMAENLRDTRNHRDALLESSPNGIITVDRQGRIILFNPAASNLTGIDVERALGSDYHGVGLSAPVVSLLERTLGHEAAILPSEEGWIRPDGSTVAVALTTSKLFDHFGKGVGALAVMIDLREKRLLEAQVLQANRLAGLGELAAGVAHEIRNPLTAIKGYTQVLDEELSEEDPKREYTAVIVKEVNRLDRIVRELLVFARPAASRFEWVTIQDVLEETLVLVDHAALRRRIDLQKDYAEHVRAEVDKEQVKQIFLNLVLNAVQAIPDDGVVRISTRTEKDHIRICVADSGVGILPEHEAKLFDPFFTTRENGTGLGLAIVHQLVELHQGEVVVNSQRGTGTEFQVRLPIQQGGVHRG